VNRLQTGIDELDLILGGGIPTGSLLVIGGPPGTGKTILANQICFANASQERQALYYTTLSEPHAKLIRFLDSFSFYDENALGRSLEIIHLPIPEQSDGLASLADEIARKSFEARPALVVIDSSKTLHDFAGSEQVRQIVYDLASKVGHTDAVLLLVGEYTPEDAERLPEFAVADGIVYLGNELHDAFDRRTLRVRKMRGSAYLGGQHSIRIGPNGVEVFARLEALAPQEKVAPRGRVSSGVPALDEMLGGGLPGRSATLIAGPSGSGKTLLSLHFINEGIRKGERCHYVSFREDPEQLLRKAGSFGFDLDEAFHEGRLTIAHPRPVELVPDEMGFALRGALAGARKGRVVIDSLGEIEQAIVGPRRFQDFLWSLVEYIACTGATSVLTTETPAFFGGALELVRGLTFATENLIMLQYREQELRIGRRVSIVMMRDSSHAKDPHEYDIDAEGFKIQPPT